MIEVKLLPPAQSLTVGLERIGVEGVLANGVERILPFWEGSAEEAG
eukprot:CAMPEP_0181336380 /NCGR_PEP_ID=MMETSP1101-20121128/27389_1 /TAXON_ID=46948 /ORGANISM="Rhodomonas abbreviata, Strain Caron Lab Isolate" /LENGTH=45 /DNA_ID= /DNA_START= /DNA_END= /DNA_ORIENTATION=